MRRGEIWRYEPVTTRPGQSNRRLVVSSNIINANDELPVVLALHLVDADPHSLLAIGVGTHGWARALSIEPVMRRRLVELLGEADTTAMDAISNALRTVQEL